MTASLFGVMALLLAGPVPAALSRAQWPLRAPRAAMTLWQAVALAAVLSAFSCGLAIAANLLVPGPDGHPTTHPIEAVDNHGWTLWVVSVTVFALTLLVGARLITTTLRLAVRTRARRSEHRDLIDLLDSAEAARGRDGELGAPDVRMLEVDTPMAYCVPGLRQRVVVSEGVVDRLAPDELRAVISHERAHLRARHDLVLEAFIAVHAAFPRVVRSESALQAAALLVELLADDQAVRETGAGPLARALVVCGETATPNGALSAGGPSTLIRVRRLRHAPDRRAAVVAYVCAAALLVLPTYAVAVPWITELSRLISG